MQNLAEKSTSRYSSSKKGKGDTLGIGQFIFGCFLLPFSLVLLWKNEKKVVTFAKCMDEGRKAVRTVEADDVDEANEYELVHIKGTTTNSTDISDNDFGIVAHNSYRLKRKVEMYQWSETVHEKDDHKTYSYEQTWREEPVNSSDFHDAVPH